MLFCFKASGVVATVDVFLEFDLGVFSMFVSWKDGVPVGPARIELPDGSAQLCR